MVNKHADLPREPVPSMIPATVARARALVFSDGWVPKSAETAVVMVPYGPLTIIPSGINSPDEGWQLREETGGDRKLVPLMLPTYRTNDDTVYEKTRSLGPRLNGF